MARATAKINTFCLLPEWCSIHSAASDLIRLSNKKLHELLTTTLYCIVNKYENGLQMLSKIQTYGKNCR